MEQKKKIVMVLFVCCMILMGIIIFLLFLWGPKKEPQEGTDRGKQENEMNDITDVQGAYNRIRPAIVKIDMGEHSGSGIIYSIDEEKMKIISSGHLLQYYESGVVTFSTGGVAIGWVTGISDTFDLGIMECVISDIPADRLAQLCAVNYSMEAYENLDEGDPVFQVGSTTGVAADFYEGTLATKDWYFEEFHADMMYLYCKATPGMSGGGTFNEKGYLVGLVSGSYLEESCAVELPDILTELEKIENSVQN